MKRISIWTVCAGVVLLLGAAQPAQARTNVSIGLHFGDRYDGPDPYWSDQPAVVLVPGTDVYYVQNSDYDIYRYGRYWYYNADGGWYRSRSYRGPWIYVGYESVPRQVGYVPTRYRRHWSQFRDDRYRYTYNRRNHGWRDRNYQDRGWNRDRNRDQNRDRYDQNGQNGDPRDRNNDGRVDWRDQNR
jgi:hypothetical protein